MNRLTKFALRFLLLSASTAHAGAVNDRPDLFAWQTAHNLHLKEYVAVIQSGTQFKVEGREPLLARMRQLKDDLEKDLQALQALPKATDPANQKYRALLLNENLSFVIAATELPKTLDHRDSLIPFLALDYLATSSLLDLKNGVGDKEARGPAMNEGPSREFFTHALDEFMYSGRMQRALKNVQALPAYEAKLAAIEREGRALKPQGNADDQIAADFLKYTNYRRQALALMKRFEASHSPVDQQTYLKLLKNADEYAKAALLPLVTHNVKHYQVNLARAK